MPTFARTQTGKWHVVGPDGCRYGRGFAEDDSAPAERVTATGIVAYEPPDATDDRRSDSSSSGDPPSLGWRSATRARTDSQRLDLPTEAEESDADLCDTCRAELTRQQRRRARIITDLKRVTPRRDLDWERLAGETRRACDWCRAHERERVRSEQLRTTVCPSCKRSFETPFGEPAEDDAPGHDRLPATPGEPIAPVVLGTTIPDYDPTDLEGSNRPCIEYREKRTYADLVFELDRTGHAFAANGLEEFERIRDEYAEGVAGDDHRTDVTLAVGTTPRSVTLEGIRPDDHRDVIEECWHVASRPDYWFPVGWPRQGYIHRRGIDSGIPGTEPVVEAFPRLETHQPTESLDAESLRSATDPARYERGRRYYEHGAVTEIERVDDRVEATVQGTRPYDVRVTLSDGSYVAGACTCPDDAVPCKHVVAAVLASGDVEVIEGERPIEDVLESTPPDDLRRLLATLADDHVAVRKRIYEDLGEG